MRRFRGNPYGLAIDRDGNVWACQFGRNHLVKLDVASGQLTEIQVGSAPRRIAASSDGMLYTVLFGSNAVAQVDPRAGRKTREWPLPSGPRGGAYAINVDADGIVWANEFHRNRIVRLDPRSGEMRSFDLPTPAAAVRKMTVDAQGRLWYLGASNGKLGVIE